MPRTPRKKKADPAPQPEAASLVAAVAEASRMPEIVHGPGHAPQIEEARLEQPRSHAAAIRKSKYNEMGKTDYVVGVRLLEHADPFLSILRFDEKPSDEVRTFVQSAGFSWRQQQREWVRPISYESRAQDRLIAERTFDQASTLLRQERGIGHIFGGAASVA